MIDFINQGKNRKAYFIILPLLISNNIFYKIEIYGIFYFKDIFNFKELIVNESLNIFIKKKIKKKLFRNKSF